MYAGYQAVDSKNRKDQPFLTYQILETDQLKSMHNHPKYPTPPDFPNRYLGMYVELN